MHILSWKVKLLYLPGINCVILLFFSLKTLLFNIIFSNKHFEKLWLSFTWSSGCLLGMTSRDPSACELNSPMEKTSNMWKRQEHGGVVRSKVSRVKCNECRPQIALDSPKRDLSCLVCSLERITPPQCLKAKIPKSTSSQSFKGQEMQLT